MKKRKTHLIIIVVVLIAFTAGIASVWMATMKMPPKGSIAIVYDDKEYYFDPAKGSAVDVSGVVMNAKGETKTISAKGYLLKDAITLSGIKAFDYTSATVLASDAFTASLTSDEIAAPDTVFLTENKADNGDISYTLVVFGDKDSKRRVKNVIRIQLVK